MHEDSIPRAHHRIAFIVLVEQSVRVGLHSYQEGLCQQGNIINSMSFFLQTCEEMVKVLVNSITSALAFVFRTETDRSLEQPTCRIHILIWTCGDTTVRLHAFPTFVTFTYRRSH